MKNKNIVGVFCQLSLISKKDPMQKCAKNANKLSNIEKSFLARFFHSAFYKSHISGAANRHAQVQYAKYVVVFFLISHHDTNPLRHLYHFRKTNIIMYWLILTVNYQGSYFPFFFFFVFVQWVKHFVPQQIV